jgi:hypothetical protein
MPADERERRLLAIGAFYDGLGVGSEGVRLPYRTRCFRAEVRERGVEEDTGGAGPTQLIDFR